MATDADRLVFGDSELYWLPNGRMTDSGLNLKGRREADRCMDDEDQGDNRAAGG